jgi:hypothetical protein
VVTPPDPVRNSLAVGGPVVLAVSCRDGFGQAAHRYAADVDAQELITLHVPGVLPVAALRGLARACARELQLLNGRGVDKHLLLLGPSGLAVLAGAAANASGPVVIPSWNGSATSMGSSSGPDCGSIGCDNEPDDVQQHSVEFPGSARALAVIKLVPWR